MFKLLITDLDDTLYSWLDFFIPAFYDMVQEISQITGIEEKKLIKEYREQHQQVNSVEYPFLTIKLPSIKQVYCNLGEDAICQKLETAFFKFNIVRNQKLKLFEGVIDSLEKIVQLGISIVGYTESAEENGFYRLSLLGIDKLFSKVYVSESQYIMPSDFHHSDKIVTVKGKKPSPQILRNICSLQNIEIADAIYIGDSLTKDIYMAKKIGMTCIQIKGQPVNQEYYSKLVDISHWTNVDFNQEQLIKAECEKLKIAPDYIVSDFTNIVELLKSIED